MKYLYTTLIKKSKKWNEIIWIFKIDQWTTPVVMRMKQEFSEKKSLVPGVFITKKSRSFLAPLFFHLTINNIKTICNIIYKELLI